ncbi:MAG: pyocin knob domain-containing protein [Cypionkella sp.]
MTALPATSDFTTAATQTLAQAAYGNQRSFLAGLFGTDGLAATALATLGALGAQYLAKSTGYSVAGPDRGALIHATSGTWTLDLLAASVAGAGFSVAVLNGGTGNITVDPASSETVDGAATRTIVSGAGIILVCTGTGWISLPMPGAAQTSAVDATAGRVMRVTGAGGSFGLGNLGSLTALTNLDSITIPSGWHAVTSATTGTRPADIGPTVFGAMEVVVYDAATIHQRLWRHVPSGLTGGYYKRVYASGAWSAWDATVMRSSLLGTVAQSGGVPTGGVIERGSNANGEYARFADGSLECYATQTASTSAGVTWTFPSPFIAAPVVTGNAIAMVLSSLCLDASPTTAAVTFSARDKTDARRADTCHLVAVGRWF